MKKGILLVSAVIALSITLAITACAPTHDVRGNLLEDYQIEQVKAGEDSVSDVLKKLGSPTTRDPFDERKWYYIGQDMEKRGILDPQVVDERVIIVAFNETGTVESIKELDNKRLDLPLIRRKTPTAGNEITVLQQLLGNLGKFNR